MNIIERIKGASSHQSGGAGFDDLALADNPMEATMRLGPGSMTPVGQRGPVEEDDRYGSHHRVGVHARDHAAPYHRGGDAEADTHRSIISEAAPSELAADFASLTAAEDFAGDSTFVSGLPVVGAWPLARQQRAMLTLFGVGLLGLLSGGRADAAGQRAQRVAGGCRRAGFDPVAAFGQIGFAGAGGPAGGLPRSRRQRFGADQQRAQPEDRRWRRGGRAFRICRIEVDALLPLVDRAEKNAKVVLDQRTTLTQVGQSLRAVNRQSG